MNVMIDDVIKNMRKLFESKKDMLTNPLNVVAIGMELMNKYKGLSGVEKKTILVEALTTIANGADGIANTEDDIIPKPVMDTIKTLIDGQLVSHMINLVSDVSKGKFDINQTVAVAKEAGDVFSGCFAFCMSKKGQKYTK